MIPTLRNYLFSAAICLPALLVASHSPETVFSEIYKKRKWAINAEGEGSSGRGSTFESTIEYREFLQSFLDVYQIKTVVDAGCGDWEFSQAIDWSGIAYTGYDVVKFVIDRNMAKYGSDQLCFVHDDIMTTDLPAADLLICKDVLMHWPNSQIQTFLRQLPKFKYCLITNDVDMKTLASTNSDIRLGGFRRLDLTLPPFSIDAIKIFSYISDGALKQVLLITADSIADSATDSNY